jgi:NADP-dependent 3-hydroxy acid dehydrogenase YdfG
MSKGLKGQSVLVTGASAGIGRACVGALVGAGASVLATGRRQAELDSLVEQYGDKAVQTMAGDLNDGGFVAELAAAACDVDIMVSNAGILKYAPLMDVTFDETEAMFRTNVLASFRITHAVAKAMAERRRGHIIVMTSIAAYVVYSLGVIYCATKHALSAIARGLRIELQGFGIKVTEIAPGMVDTGIRATSDHPAVLAALESRAISALTPQEVAEAVAYAAQAADNCCPDLVELRPRGSAST